MSEVLDSEAVGYWEAIRWLDRQAGAQVAVSHVVADDTPAPIAFGGILQQGVIEGSDWFGDGRQYAVLAGSTVVGSFWLAEDQIVGAISRWYLDGDPVLRVPMAFEHPREDGDTPTLMVLLEIRMLNAAAIARIEEKTG